MLPKKFIAICESIVIIIKVFMLKSFALPSKELLCSNVMPENAFVLSSKEYIATTEVWGLDAQCNDSY